MVVLLTANGAVAPFVQQEIGVARGARKLIVPIVQHGIDAGTLAMLAGVERIEVDFGDLSEALTTVRAKLEPFVQTESKRLAAAATAGTPATAQPSPLVLAGLGLLVLALFLVFSRS